MFEAMILAAALQVAEEDDGLWGDAPGAIAPEYQNPGDRFYDFWAGEWRSNWRPREEDGLDHVETGVQNRQHVFTILGGKALLEFAEPFDLDPDTPAGRGFSLRYRNSDGQWVMAQHWPNVGWDGVAFLDQLIGEEHHGRVQLYSYEPQVSTPDAPAARRYTFSDIAPERFRWDGANTSDAGDSWSVWQVVDFYRQAEHATRTPEGEAWPGHHNGLLCTDEPHGAFDAMRGRWTFRFEREGRDTIDGALVMADMLEGCAIGGLIRMEGQEAFMGLAYSPMLQLWSMINLTDAPGEAHVYMIAPGAGGEGAVFRHMPELTITDKSANYYAGLAPATGGNIRMIIETLGEDEMVWRREALRDEDWIDAGVMRFSRVD
jgi:hypothetical protein